MSGTKETSWPSERSRPITTSPATRCSLATYRCSPTSPGRLETRRCATGERSAVVLALGGTYVVAGPKGRREIPASEFHLGFLETALEPDEALTEIRVGKWGEGGWGFEKLTKRAQDWAIVGVVAVRREVPDGAGAGAVAAGSGIGVALVNMASVPVRAASTETALADGASIADAAALADADCDPAADVNASVEYRRHLARVLVRRALEQASR